MSDQGEKEKINGELKMIKDLREKIYGDADAGPQYPYSDKDCVFCGKKDNLNLYRNFYICNDCLRNL